MTKNNNIRVVIRVPPLLKDAIMENIMYDLGLNSKNISEKAVSQQFLHHYFIGVGFKLKKYNYKPYNMLFNANKCIKCECDECFENSKFIVCRDCKTFYKKEEDKVVLINSLKDLDK